MPQSREKEIVQTFWSQEVDLYVGKDESAFGFVK